MRSPFARFLSFFSLPVSLEASSFLPPPPPPTSLRFLFSTEFKKNWHKAPTTNGKKHDKSSEEGTILTTRRRSEWFPRTIFRGRQEIAWCNEVNKGTVLSSSFSEEIGNHRHQMGKNIGRKWRKLRIGSVNNLRYLEIYERKWPLFTKAML